MNKHVSKLLQPGVFWYCLILLAFAVAAALLDQYYLAAGELVVRFSACSKPAVSSADKG